MPQSFSAIFVHAVFSTRDRISFFEDRAVRDHLHHTLGKISEKVDCPPLRVGGVSDHVHVLAGLGRQVSPSDWIKEVKRQSSLWVKDRYPLKDFGWQSGYGAFSVSQANLETVIRYIDTQEVHHQKISFQDEFMRLLREHGIQYDERYLWS